MYYTKEELIRNLQMNMITTNDNVDLGSKRPLIEMETIDISDEGCNDECCLEETNTPTLMSKKTSK